MIKMVVTDIDGTIYTPEIGIKDSIKQCLKGLINRGIKVVIATGRTYLSAKSMADRFDIKVPLICYQGALVKEYTGETIDIRNLNSKPAREVIEFLRKNNLHTNVYINDQLYVEQDDVYIKDYITDKGINYNVVKSFDELDFNNLNKILAINYDKDLVTKLVQDLQTKFPSEINVVKSTDFFCEVSNPTATKGEALKLLAKKYGIKSEETLAIGDQDNDIDMVVSAGVGVAMGNSSFGLKEKADYITDTVQNDGFIKAIEKYIEV